MKLFVAITITTAWILSQCADKDVAIKRSVPLPTETVIVQTVARPFYCDIVDTVATYHKEQTTTIKGAKILTITDKIPYLSGTLIIADFLNSLGNTIAYADWYKSKCRGNYGV
ncbi:MAG: hypothetical protein LE178_04330 [Endomicrobium sp.]|nr:hypothetical protein [Endomicrobium sp.]